MLIKGSDGGSIILPLLAVVILAACAGDGALEEDSGVEPPPADETEAAPPLEVPGIVTAVATHTTLSPQAQIQAEGLMCVCGCGMRLADCTCQKDPGGISMKKHLQSLVEEGLTPSQVEKAMVEAYGEAVLP